MLSSFYSLAMLKHLSPFCSFIAASCFLVDQVHSFPFALSLPLITRREIFQNTLPLIVVAMASSSSSSASSPNSDSSVIRWGIVGLGDVCQKKSGPAFWKCHGSELVAVMRRSSGKAAAFAKNVPGGKCVGYDTLEEFLQHHTMDAVYVATRPGTHLEICRKVAAAGKACYVEKPVGRCAEETKQIAKFFKDAGLPLYTAYISRAYDRTQVIRQLLKEGAIGDRLTKVSYKLIGTGGARDMDGDELPWRLDAKQSGGGLVMDVGCHVVDRIDFICGPLENVKGKAENRNSPKQAVEDFVELTAKVGKGGWAAMPACKGASVDLTWDFASTKSPLDELRFIGPKGVLKMAGMSPNGPIEVLDVDGKVLHKLEFEMPEHTAQQLIQAVTNDLRGFDKVDLLSYADNAIRAQTVLDSSLNSYYGGREIGYWDREKSWPGRPK